MTFRPWQYAACSDLGSVEEIWARRVVMFRAWQSAIFDAVHRMCYL